MSVEPGDEIVVDVEKAAAGGRMLARHEGQVVLVWGAIPGERVRARVEKRGKGLLYADTTAVLVASADRRDPGPDWRCGGNALAHMAYERQLSAKSEILQESLRRIGRLTLSVPPTVYPSPEHGYRMRARLHARDGRIGFFREGSHQLCDVSSTGQLRSATVECVGDFERLIAAGGLQGLTGLDLAEDVSGSQRACHLVLEAGIASAPFASLAAAPGVTGLSAASADRPGIDLLSGVAAVSDRLGVGRSEDVLVLRRSARAFFQGNRYLLEHLVRHVDGLVPPGPVVDLYAGVGLFGLYVAASRGEAVTLVEGDPVSSADLVSNAEPYVSRVRTECRSVESYLRVAGRFESVIMDPPRTGLSREAIAGVIRCAPAHIVYVSCDPATLARDSRTLLDAKYELVALAGFDLFPNTAHVEAVAAFARLRPSA